MNTEPKREIKEGVLSAIESGRAKMRSRWYFLFGSFLLGAGVTLFIIALCSLASFVFFSVRQSGAWFAPGFGARGWFAFFHALPLTLILLMIVLAIILESLVKRYAFAYRKPLLYSFLVIAGLVIIAGIFLAPFHRPLLMSARRNQLPIGGFFYRGYGDPRINDIHRGVITATTSNGFMTKNAEGGTTRVIITSGTRIFPGPMLRAGDSVVIFGDQESDTVEAYGIRQIDEAP